MIILAQISRKEGLIFICKIFMTYLARITKQFSTKFFQRKKTFLNYFISHEDAIILILDFAIRHSNRLMQKQCGQKQI